MRFSFSTSFVAVVLVEVWGVEGNPVVNEPPQLNEYLLDPSTTLEKRAEGSNSVLVTAVAAVLIVVLLIALVVGGIYFLRRHMRSTVREIELKPSLSRAGNRDSDPSIRSSTTTTTTSDDFSAKELEAPGISLQRIGTDPASKIYELDATRDEESAVGMSRDHLQTLRYEATSPSPSINSVSSTAPLVSGSEHHNAQPSFAAGHKRRISRQQHRLSVQTTFRTLMVEHSEGSPLSASTVLEQFEGRQAMKSPGLKSPSTKSPLRSPGLYKTPRNQD
ncbi:hypothetical protein DM02DRAFT_623375 [Periconia macrospinosa]|uniref:Uncharacterized protein n=1 Tax=Periconia macrospinosa TaxID=97972 RepID=A0A2V1E6T4_9PLEO|nr:hypothetical protein DM02DRAFT_623375 [Periconia macrospinosa]